MMRLPAGRFLTIPLPPGPFSARILAAAMRVPLVFFAIYFDSCFIACFLVTSQRLLGRKSNRIVVHCDRGNPCQRPAFERRAGCDGDRLISHDGAFERRSCGKRCGEPDLPKNVRIPSPTAKDNLLAASLAQGIAYLENPATVPSPFTVQSNGPGKV